jgi:hypothetical protein
MLNLPPQQEGRYSPLGVPRDHPEVTDDDEEYIQFLCELATAIDSPAAHPR